MDLLGSFEQPSSQAPPSQAPPSIQAPNLMDMMATTSTMANQTDFETSQIGSKTSQTGSQTGQTDSNEASHSDLGIPKTSLPPIAMTPSLLDDLSTIDTSGIGSGSSGVTALTLYEGNLGSVRVPSELAQFPVVVGWDNKVCVCVCIKCYHLLMFTPKKITSICDRRISVVMPFYVYQSPRYSNQTSWWSYCS